MDSCAVSKPMVQHIGINLFKCVRGALQLHYTKGHPQKLKYFKMSSCPNVLSDFHHFCSIL